ncbi:MAG TPA: DUF3108 domain-containing protein [Burkholderiales bacterium]|nr:DUF3108 domain-containing protein [Burkholderiales bacterium]
MALAAGLSGVAHALVAGYAHFELPEAPADRIPLAVRIAEAPPRAPPSVAPPKPKRRARPDVQVAAAVAMPSPIPAAIGDPEDPVVEDAPAVESAEAPQREPVVVAEAPKPGPEAAPEPAAPVRKLPRRGRITYDMLYGRDGFPAGRTVQTWEADQGRYRLASHSETIGIVDLIRSQYRTYSSRGAVTREGLKPESFKMVRNRGRGRANEEASAQFDWKQATLTLGRTAEQRQVKLPPKSQDLLSFIFQLSLDPPAPGRLSQVVTTGSRIEVYELDVLGEEVIDTPLGMMRALPIKQVRKGNEESIELWLALEYRYLPVKLRFFDKQGEPQGEQVVADIRLIEN